jgi:nitroreductase
VSLIVPSNIKTYYSGGIENASPRLSIGGAMSEEEWFGENLQDLFDAVRMAESALGTQEWRCIYVRNEDANASGMIDTLAWITKQSIGGLSYAIGLALEGVNGVAEELEDAYHGPSGVSSSSPLTKDTALDLGALAQYDSYAIWISCTVAPATPDAQSSEAILRIEATTQL